MRFSPAAAIENARSSVTYDNSGGNTIGSSDRGVLYTELTPDGPVVSFNGYGNNEIVTFDSEEEGRQFLDSGQTYANYRPPSGPRRTLSSLRERNRPRPERPETTIPGQPSADESAQGGLGDAQTDFDLSSVDNAQIPGLKGSVRKMANGNFSYSTYNNASDTYSGNGRSTTRAVRPEEMADIIGVSVGELTGAPTTPATIRPPYAGPTDLDRISAGLLGDAQTQSGGIADAQTQFDDLTPAELEMKMNEEQAGQKRQQELMNKIAAKFDPETAANFDQDFQDADTSPVADYLLSQTQFDTSPQDMFGRIMSEKDNMDLDFNGNGSVTPEDARVYAQQHAEQQTTTSATTPPTSNAESGGNNPRAGSEPVFYSMVASGEIFGPVPASEVPRSGTNIRTTRQETQSLVDASGVAKLQREPDSSVDSSTSQTDTSGGLGDAQTQFDTSPQDMFGRIMSEKDNMELDFNGNGSVTPEDARVYAMQHAENTASNVTSPNPNNFNYNEGFESGEGNTIGTNDKGVLSKNLLPGGGFEYQFIDHSGKVVENFGTDLDNAKGFLEGKPPTTVAPVVTADPVVDDPAVDDVFDVDSVVDSVPDPIETVAPTIPETVAPTIPDPIETVAPTVTETVADPIEEIPVAAPPQIGEEGNPGITSFGNMSAGDLQRQINRGNIAPDNVANAQARITQLENEQFTKPQGILAAPGLTPVNTPQQDVLAMERRRQMAKNPVLFQRRVGGPADGQPIQQGNLGQPVMSDRDSYINQQIAPVLYQSNEDYKTGRQAAGDRYDENSSVYQPDNLSSGLGGANPNGMGGAGQGGFQFPMQRGNPNQAIRDGAMNRLSGQPAETQPQQTPYAQNSGYGMTMDRHGTQSATPQPAYGAASPLSNIPSVQPQSPAYSGFDTGGYTSYNTPAVQSPYPAQSPYGG